MQDGSENGYLGILPMLSEFLKRRAELDLADNLLTDYWRDAQRMITPMTHGGR